MTNRSLWNDNLTLTLLYLVKEEFNGSSCENGLKQKEYKRVVSEFNAKSPVQMTATQIQSQMGNLKKKYNIYHDITMNSGFGFDEITGLYTACPEVWHAYIKAHPNAGSFRNKPLKFYDLLYEIYNGRSATGRFAVSSFTKFSIEASYFGTNIQTYKGSMTLESYSR